MTTPTVFPRATGRRRGYDPAAVDAFIDRARVCFASRDGDTVTSAEVRAIVFPLIRGGYQAGAVDAALGRIEDAFAARERERAMSQRGARAWVRHSRELAQEVLDRLRRRPRHRFARTRGFSYGYRIDEVDLVADRIADYLEHGEPLTVDQVRAVAFRPQWRGYRHRQVDAVLDAVVQVMLAVR
ncbi:DivIVA domain-containing protein [Microbacterium sp.]|uniref:DivIVA domain-containing protein n=1 Tax=Microbacterium sp. TaxID=51671 RepID=UPI003A859E6D